MHRQFTAYLHGGVCSDSVVSQGQAVVLYCNRHKRDILAAMKQSTRGPNLLPALCLPRVVATPVLHAICDGE